MNQLFINPKINTLKSRSEKLKTWLKIKKIYYSKTTAKPIAPILANDSESLIKSLSQQPPLSLPSAGARPMRQSLFLLASLQDRSG